MLIASFRYQYSYVERGTGSNPILYHHSPGLSCPLSYAEIPLAAQSLANPRRSSVPTSGWTRQTSPAVVWPDLFHRNRNWWQSSKLLARDRGWCPLLRHRHSRRLFVSGRVSHYCFHGLVCKSILIACTGKTRKETTLTILVFEQRHYNWRLRLDPRPSRLT